MPLVLGRELIDDAAVGGKQVERIAQPLVVGRRGVAGEGVVAGRVVVLHRVRERADQRHLVHPLGRLGQLLADLDVRAARRDRRQRPANAVGGVGLHVEHVDVARPAPLEQEDHPLGPRPCGPPAGAGWLRPRAAAAASSGRAGPRRRRGGCVRREKSVAMRIESSLQAKSRHGYFPRRLKRPRMPVGRDAHRVALAVGGDGELDVVALAFPLFVGDVFVGDVVRRAVGPQVLVDLIDGFERLGVLAGWRRPRAGSPWSCRCS